MWAYSALLIPILAAIAMLVFYKRKVVWWELGLPILVSLLLIVGVKKLVEYGRSIDTDYHGSFIVEARYYEYWETYVHKTCTRSCGKNCTTTYDCSYCDEHRPYWEVIDNYGNRWNISKSYFEILTRKWKATPEFVDMHRNISHSFSCGKDGDMYRIKWDRKFESAEPSVSTHHYINKVKVSHSTFSYPIISKKEADKIGLYSYPEIYESYKQECILGVDSIYKNPQDARYIKHLFKFFNAKYGVSKKVKLFVLMFYDKSMGIATEQEAYWEGGNDNEVIVCIGVDRATSKLSWVKVFSWCDNKRLHVEIREEIMKFRKFDYLGVYWAIESSVDQYFTPKDFNDFDYLTVDLPGWSLVLIYFITLAVTCAVSYWAVNNTYEYERS